MSVLQDAVDIRSGIARDGVSIVDRDQLIEELSEATLKSEQMLKDHWDTIMEGRLFKRMQRACEQKGISYSGLTREEWRELAIEVALGNDDG